MKLIAIVKDEYLSRMDEVLSRLQATGFKPTAVLLEVGIISGEGDSTDLNIEGVLKIEEEQTASISTDDEAVYKADLLSSGKAVRVPEGQKLPPGATHMIVEENGHLKLERLRFSAV